MGSRYIKVSKTDDTSGETKLFQKYIKVSKTDVACRRRHIEMNILTVPLLAPVKLH